MSCTDLGDMAASITRSVYYCPIDNCVLRQHGQMTSLDLKRVQQMYPLQTRCCRNITCQNHNYYKIEVAIGCSRKLLLVDKSRYGTSRDLRYFFTLFQER